MKSLFSYLILIVAVMYWIFRVAVSFMYSLGHEFICMPYNVNIEIALLFLTVPCLALVMKKNVIAATLYFGMHAAYFGTVLYNSLMGVETFDFMNSTSLALTGMGVLIPFLVFCDVIIERNSGPVKNKNTDWYYTNDKYEREYDERADRNQYKIR